jgi:hypothetical protein
MNVMEEQQAPHSAEGEAKVITLRLDEIRG